MANLISLGRVALLLVTVGLLYSASPALIVLAAAGVVVVIAADVADGWVARRRGESSRFGAILDIAADRAVEAVYLVVFADLGLIPLWPVVLVLVRGFLVDAMHAAAATEGYTAFGTTTHLRSKWARQLSASRWSRGLYGGAKAFTFTYLAALVAWQAATPPVEATGEPLATLLRIGLICTLFTVSFCLARGLAVLYEGRTRFWPAAR